MPGRGDLKFVAVNLLCLATLPAVWLWTKVAPRRGGPGAAPVRRA